MNDKQNPYTHTFQMGKTYPHGMDVDTKGHTRYWIGRNNFAGRLRYRYYKYRGWILPNGIFYKKSRKEQ